MVRFDELNRFSNELFLRTVGLSRECVEVLVEKIRTKVDEEKEKRPLTKRGLKGIFTIEDKILVTLYYLRHYPTLESLAGIFSISKSYVHTIYHKYSSIMVKIFHVEGAKSLNPETLTTVLMDVTEQPIERPKKGQKEYYSGKKNGTQ